MLAPAHFKYRKQFKGKIKGKAHRGNKLAFGDVGLQSTEAGWLTERQIEAGRIAATRHIKRGGKIWIRIFPDKPIGKKPAETRMGKGKGTPDSWVAVVKPGTMIYEIQGVSDEMASEALRLSSHKMPLATRLVKRSDAL